MSRAPAPPPGAWQTSSSRTVFAGGPVQEVVLETVQLPDGRMIADYYSVRLGDYVLIFAEMSDGRIPLLRQYKHGARRVCLTFPGGGIEPGESPLQAATRELREETGCVASEWRDLGRYVTNANQGCGAAHLFMARGCRIESPPTSPDIEGGALQLFTQDELLAPGRLADMGLTSHVALLLLATHPEASRLL